MDIEAEPLENSSSNEYELQDHEPKQRIRRSNTDAKDLRPKLRVGFSTLPHELIRNSRRFSDDDVDLVNTRAHQIGRANWSGGWQNTILTQRRRGYKPISEEDVVTEIAEAMVDDQRLMADDVDGEVLRRDALRELTKSLKMRREIKQQLTLKRSSMRSRSKNVSYYSTFKYSVSMKWFKFKLSVSGTMHDFSLWHKDLKDIEGIYGSSIGTYFSFLRYLFILNLLVSVVIIGFLFIPQMLYDQYYIMDETLNNESSSKYQMDNYTAKGIPFRAMDLFTGAGWFSDTLLYYGGYSYTNMFSLFNSNLQYDIPQAYIFTMLACYGFYLTVILHQIFKLYRENYNEDVSKTVVEKVFSAWDFSIIDEPAAKIKHRSIYNELIEMLQEFNDEDEIFGFFPLLRQRVINFIMWAFSLTFLVVLGFSLYILLQDSLADFTDEDDNYWRWSFELLVYPLIVTIIMVIVPAIFEAIGRFEKYKKSRHELYSTLIRVTLLQLTILLVLATFWYTNSPGLHNDSPADPAFNVTFTNQSREIVCWETAMGEEIYRLIFIDFVAILISVLVIDTSKKHLVASGKADKSLQEFALPRNILHIIYNQTLLWVGLFFCPLIPLIISIKFLIIFYLQKFNVMKNLQPLDRPLRAAQTETLYYTLSMISFFLCFFSLVFILVKGHSSEYCGPFQFYDFYGDIILSSSEEQFLIKVLAWSLQPSALFFFIVIVSIGLYCVKSVAEGRLELVEVLRKQLGVEMKDRIFLQRLIEKVQRGEYVPGSPRVVPSSPAFQGGGDDSGCVTRRSSFVFSRSPEQASGTTTSNL